MALKPINSSDADSLHARVLVQLRDLILAGQFAPGERMAEIPLAERLDASRTPVRSALATLANEGLVEASPAGGYMARRFTPREVADAIAVRGVLEGMAARVVAEHGVSRQLALDLQSCLEHGDRVLGRAKLDYDGYAAYIAMNDRFHALIVDAAGNDALKSALDTNSHLPFAPPSAMLPMQASVKDGVPLLVYAHRQHHMLVAALKAGQGARAQALGEEHTQVALINLQHALDRPDESAMSFPAMRLVTGS